MTDRKDRAGSVADAIMMRSVASGGEESQIREEWKNIIDARHRVRMLQFYASILANLVAFVGLLFVGLPLWFSGAVSTWWDCVLVGCFAALAVLLFWGGVEVSMKEYPKRRRGVVTGLGVGVVLGAIALATLRFGEPEWWHPLAIVVGLCVVGPALFLAFNQQSELVDPMGWPSSWERLTWPVVKRLLEMEIDELQLVERSLFPYLRGGRLEQYISARQEEGTRVDVPAADDLNLRDFLAEAVRRGLGRDENWLKSGQPRYRLPSTGTLVTRSTYDKMIGMAARLGYVEQGGDGEATAWLVEPADAWEDWNDRLVEEWGELVGGEE